MAAPFTIAPSIAALAGVDVQRAVDGRADLFSLDGGWSDAEGVLIQAGSDLQPWLWRGVRTSRWTYVRRVGGGTVLVEVAFGLRGVGKLTADALQSLDLAMVMAAVLYAAVFVVLSSAAVDALQAALDPRQR